MEINVTSINGINTEYEMRKPASLMVDVNITEYQIRELFYQLWEYVGNELKRSIEIVTES